MDASCTRSAASPLPRSRSMFSKSSSTEKYCSIWGFSREFTITTPSTPSGSRASSTTYWRMGLSRTGRSSLGMHLVAGRKRVPRPAAGMIAFIVVVFPSIVCTCGQKRQTHHTPAHASIAPPSLSGRPPPDCGRIPVRRHMAHTPSASNGHDANREWSRPALQGSQSDATWCRQRARAP